MRLIVGLLALFPLFLAGCQSTPDPRETALECSNIHPNEGFSFTSQDWRPGTIKVVGFGQFVCNKDVVLDKSPSLQENAVFDDKGWYGSIGPMQEEIGLLNSMSDLKNFKISAEPISELTTLKAGVVIQIFGELQSILSSEHGKAPVTELTVPLKFRSQPGSETFEVLAKASLGIE